MAFSTDIYEGCSGGFLYCLANWVNTITDGNFWSMFLIAFVVVLFLATYRYGTVRAFGFSTFGGGMFAFYLLFMSLITWWFASIFFIALGVGLVIMKMSSS